MRSHFFISEAAEYIFYLLHLDGNQRMEKLKITKFHYSNKQYATDWKNHIMTIIDPKNSSHPEADKAVEMLNTFYTNMIK